MYGKVAIAAAGLLAAVDARPHRFEPMTTATGAATTTDAVTLPTPAFTDVVHSTTPESVLTALSTGTLAATTNLLNPGIPTPGATTNTLTTPTSVLTGVSTPTTNLIHPTFPASAYTGVSTGSGAASTGGAFPLPADPSPEQIAAIEQQAHGELSNKGAPTGFHPDTLNAVAFIAFNEQFEVSYFSKLVDLISSNAPNFTASDIAPADPDTVLANLKVILAQEELHALNAQAILKANGRAPIAPCTYKFPVESFGEAISTASLFTDMVLGTLPDIQTVGAVNGDFGLVGAVGSVVGQEGEQNGFYRSILGKVPSQLPFLTGAARGFAFNAILQNFIDTCPSATLDALEMPNGGTPLNQTGTLTVLSASNITLDDQTLNFSVQTVDVSKTHEYYANAKTSMNYITYVNQQNAPLSVPIDQSSIQFANNEITFSASFPAKTEFLNGFTIAAVTETSNLTSPDAVASAMNFGPGLIEVD